MKRREFLGNVIAMPLVTAAIKRQEQSPETPIIASSIPAKPPCRQHKMLVDIMINCDDCRVEIAHQCSKCWYYHIAEVAWDTVDPFNLNLYCVIDRYQRLLQLPPDSPEARECVPLPPGCHTEERQLSEVIIWEDSHRYVWSR